MHFVLVHGACHGAWCWYKLETLLKSAGHNVTSLDMASAGVSTTPYFQIQSVSDYFEPLTKFMESVQESVVLVVHSYAGLGLCMMMERFPEKIAIAVFAAASMPGPNLCPADVVRELMKGRGSETDNRFDYDDGPHRPPTSFCFGPHFMSVNLYQHCSPQDFTLANKLLRPARVLNQESISKEITMSEEKYETVHRAYLITGDDIFAKRDLQLWMIKNNPPDIVKEIRGSDHMVMLSKSKDLYASLQEIVE